MQADKLTSCKLQCIPCKLTSSRLTSRLSWQVVHTTLSLTPRSCSPQWWCHHHWSSAWGPASRTISDTYYIFGNNHCSNQAAVTFWFTYSAKVYVKYWGQNLRLQEAMSRKIWMQLNKSDNKSEWNQVEWSEDESGHKTNHLTILNEFFVWPNQGIAYLKNHALNGNSVQGLKVSTCGELSVELHPQSNSKTWINQVVVLFKLNFSSKTWRCQVLVGKFNFKLNFLAFWVSSTLSELSLQNLVAPSFGG